MADLAGQTCRKSVGVGAKIKKAPGLAGQELQVGAYRQVATHIHVREVNKSSNGILYLHGQRFQQRKGLFHAVFADDKGT